MFLKVYFCQDHVDSTGGCAIMSTIQETKISSGLKWSQVVRTKVF